MCQLETLEIAQGQGDRFSFKSGEGLAGTDGKTYVNWEQITHELDK